MKSFKETLERVMEAYLYVRYPKLKNLKFLFDDLTIAYEGWWDNRHVIVKLKGEKADGDNEAEVLKYLEEKQYPHSPRLVLADTEWIFDDALSKHLGDHEYLWQILIREFVEGEVIRYPLKNKEKIWTDISSQILELWHLGLIVGDVRVPGNVVKRQDGSYILYNHDRTFSRSGTPFPPMDFMGDDFPTLENTLKDLEDALK